MRFTEFVVLIAAMMATQAMAVDAMLPAFPIIVGALRVANPNHGQWILTAYMAGLGCGQLFWGMMSDRFGRRPVLLTGLALQKRLTPETVPDDLALRVGQMRESAERAGRDPDAIELSVSGYLPTTTEEEVATAEAAGIRRMLLSTSMSPDLDGLADEVSAFAERFGPLS